MAVFDTAEANRLLDAAFSTADYVGATTGSKLRLATATGTDAAAGTEVTGGSYTAGGQAMTMAAASARSCSNSGTVQFTGMPVATVTGVDIYNSGGTQRKAYGALTTSRTTAAGDTLSFAAGSIVASFS